MKLVILPRLYEILLGLSLRLTRVAAGSLHDSEGYKLGAM